MTGSVSRTRPVGQPAGLVAMMLAPMTFIVTLGLIAAVVVGVIVLARAFGSGQVRRDLELGVQSRCPHCQHANPTHAKYCSMCGKTLS